MPALKETVPTHPPLPPLPVAGNSPGVSKIIATLGRAEGEQDEGWNSASHMQGRCVLQSPAPQKRTGKREIFLSLIAELLPGGVMGEGHALVVIM